MCKAKTNMASQKDLSSERHYLLRRLRHISDSEYCRPFVIDLDSTNGTHVNDETIPTTRFYELKPSDGTYVHPLLRQVTVIDTFCIITIVLKFGQSTREYVLLHDEVS